MIKENMIIDNPLNKNKKKLSEQDTLFLDALFDESNPETFNTGTKSAAAAGFKPGSAHYLKNKLAEEIVERTQKYLATHGLTAASTLLDVRNNPADRGAANKLNAANSILDRIGIVKQQQIEVHTNAPSAIIYIPAKEVIPSDDASYDAEGGITD